MKNKKYIFQEKKEYKSLLIETNKNFKYNKHCKEKKEGEENYVKTK